MTKSYFDISFSEGLLRTVMLFSPRPKSSFALTTRLDQVGMIASSLCAAHCLLMPFAVGLLPLFGLSFLADEQTEWALIAIALLVGLGSLVSGFWLHHRKAQPLLVFAVGAGLILLVRLGLEEIPWLELFGVVAGGGLLVAAHALNLRYCRWCCRPSSQS